jgi:hypothetical protein
VAQQAGLNIPNVWGGVDHKRSIIEAKGSGLAFFDYDNDGWLDIYLTNGNRLDAHWPPGQAPTSHLYKNNRDGTFTDVTEKSGWGAPAGRPASAWAITTMMDGTTCSAASGDITFSSVTTEMAPLPMLLTKPAFLRSKRAAGAPAVLFSIMTGTVTSIFSFAITIKLDPDKIPSRRTRAFCQWKGVPIMCGPRGLPGDTNILYHNNGDGTFTDVSEKAGILKPGPRYSITAVSYDFDNDGWPDIYVAVDSEPSILFKNNHDGTFTDIAVMAGCAYNDDGHEQAGMGIGVADYDCDGWFDIFKTNFADDTSNLYHNNGDGTFSDRLLQLRCRDQQPLRGMGLRLYRLRQRWLAGHCPINGHVYPEIDNYNFGRRSRIRDWSTRISAMADSKMSRPRWGRHQRAFFQPGRRIRRL